MGVMFSAPCITGYSAPKHSLYGSRLPVPEGQQSSDLSRSNSVKLTGPDEVFIRMGGELHYLWRAVDKDGDVIDILSQRRRNARAAKGHQKFCV